MNIQLGADPEVFFSHGDLLISAIGKVGGTKAEPRDLGGGFAVQEDNVAAEYNVPPASTQGLWDTNINHGLRMLEEYARNNNCVLSLRASGQFGEEQLDHPQAKEFGCEPDYNAWKYGEVNDSPVTEDPSLRTAGGHVHVSGIAGLDPLNVVRAMDLFLGVPSVVLDSDNDRRRLYGKAGAFRPKEYIVNGKSEVGVEYRVLSNFWIFSRDTRLWVWRATMLAIDFARDFKLDPESDTGKLIVNTINNSDFDGYKALLTTYPDIHPNFQKAA